nr:ShlB/FhaC/HecB family hemolysin secretion/activation protein [Silvimonas terrae]
MAPLTYAKGEPSSQLAGVSWEGVSYQTTQRLLNTHIEPRMRSSIDAAAIDALCDELTQALRAAGYVVGQVVVAPRDRQTFLQTGQLHFTVFEGKVGAISLSNTSRVADDELRKIATGALCPNGVGDQCTLTSARLERAQLLLQDLPGVHLNQTTLSPQGVGVGQTSVGINVESNRPLVGGYVGLDSYGNPATGVGEFNAGVTLTNLFHEGDVIQAAGLVTNRRERAGSLAVSVPVNHQGLRAQAGYSHTMYSVPEVNSSGNADTVNVGLSYPLVRELDRNWTLSGDGLDTRSRQEVNGMQAFATREIGAGRVTIAGNAGDRPIYLDQSYWSGSLAWMAGAVAQDLQGAQDVTGQLGGFNKFNLNGLGKLKLNSSDWYLLANLQLQYATSNLDSSQKLAIGGQNGVRAYRPDEGSFDSGAVVSFDLRRSIPMPNGDQLSVGPLVDYASGVVNKREYSNWQTMDGYSDPTLGNHRKIAGWGIAADYVSPHGYSANVAWSRRFGDSPDSVNHPGSAQNRFLGSVSMKF